MGGKDVIYLKQQHSSTLQPADVQKKLKEMADRRFLDANSHYTIASDQVFPNDKVCEQFFEHRDRSVFIQKLHNMVCLVDFKPLSELDICGWLDSGLIGVTTNLLG